MLIGMMHSTHLTGMEQVPGIVRQHASRAGLHNVVIYLSDLQQIVLRPLVGHTEVEVGGEAELRIDTTLAGRAFQEVRIIPRAGPDGIPEWWVPLVDGTERLGVLLVSAPEDEYLDEALRILSSIVALMVISKRDYSDSFARLRRAQPMNIAAEMQWKLMPPLVFANADVVIAGVLEPAYTISGDAFDYAIDGDTAYLEIFDAMGHNTTAGLTAHLAVAASRNSRRQGADLKQSSERVEQVLIEEFGPANRFTTAIQARLNTATGLLTWVNRGHPPPVLIRGARWSSLLHCPPAHPLGLDLDLPVTVCAEQLQPGDRVLLYTDGITEARNAADQEFGLDRFIDFVIAQATSGLPVPETLRRLIRDVLAYNGGRLQDDATVLEAAWHGPSHRLTSRGFLPPAPAAADRGNRH